MSETELYKRLKDHDLQAMEEFVKLYKDFFFDVAENILKPEFKKADIACCIAEAIVYMWYHMDAYDSEKYTLAGWGVTIVGQKALRMLKRRLKHRNRLDKNQNRAENDS